MTGKRKEFGLYLKGVRIAKDLSQHKVSALLGYKSNGTLNAVEQGFAPVPLEKIHPLIRLYGLDPAFFLARLADCEPELYDRYMTLKKQFEDEFMSNLRSAIIGGRTDQASAREATHHGRLGRPGADVNDSLLHFLYIMSTFLGVGIPTASFPQKQLEIPFYPDQNLNLWENAYHA